ncbi:uncharacterized protein LOC130691028 isoform X2 [Daphnia carinata]|uniref:uncharacterized protein LOC130691028 isoform X2 n=1 Tax=Daphnia carinata TaxID=120202 RepID=UPI002579EDB6|nr:uncharacterized protein LOC130691028 isoform X2 [Daphnia carinata]
MNFFVLFSAFISVATTAPVILHSGITSQSMVRSTPIFAGSSMNMYSPFYYLTAKLKLLPKDIIICIINPTKCDPPLSAPTGYIAPVPEVKVPYSEISVGEMPHVDVFDTAVASHQADESDHFPQDEPAQLRLNSDESTKHHMIYKHQSSQISSENFTAQRSNIQIPVRSSQDNAKVHFNMLAHTAN